MSDFSLFTFDAFISIRIDILNFSFLLKDKFIVDFADSLIMAKTVTLRSGDKMPLVGLGTWQVRIYFSHFLSSIQIWHFIPLYLSALCSFIRRAPFHSATPTLHTKQNWERSISGDHQDENVKYVRALSLLRSPSCRNQKFA